MRLKRRFWHIWQRWRKKVTKIEWVKNQDGTPGKTWNPVTGCTPTSEGCRNCYAKRMARRLAGRYGYPEAPHHFDVTLHEDRLEQPLRWRKPRQVFVCSMGDLFHKDVPEWYILRVWSTIYRSPQHVFQILTKRPERMLKFVSKGPMSEDGEPLSNVWLGVTTENQQTADERIPLLLQTPAAVRFVSCEPLLSRLDLSEWLPPVQKFFGTNGVKITSTDKCISKLSLVIVGGETGPGARPMHPDWARGPRDQCQEAGVSFFFKKWGRYAPFTDGLYVKDDGCIPGGNTGRFLDGCKWNEMPEVIR